MALNPLDEYRRAQRALRKEYDAFNIRNCPTCPKPCCVHPARVGPTDILLAQGIGWKSPVPVTDELDEVQRVAGQLTGAITNGVDEDVRPPCEFLGEKGCVFPADLRPFGCTEYICPIMFERADRKTLTRVKRLVRELQRRHDDLQKYLCRGK